jgi:uncharacterized repeat protein (TIGR03803 family)
MKPLALAAALFATISTFALASEYRPHTLYAFTGGRDGKGPTGLATDDAGNFYVSTYSGGDDACAGGSGCGAIVRIAPDGHATVLHDFTGGTDGAFPGPVSVDALGNVYGTTSQGGGHRCYQSLGCGTVYRLSPDGTEKVLYRFSGDSDGAYPMSPVLLDDKGGLVGTTSAGGTGCGDNGCGTVFRLDRHGRKTMLHEFVFSDGHEPLGALVADKHGALYGTTLWGGTNSCGCGVAYKVTADGAFAVLHSFSPATGSNPGAGLTLGPHGRLYGTTNAGGSENVGTVFGLAPDGTEIFLHSLNATAYGPDAVLIDSAGDLLGPFGLGGRSPCEGGLLLSGCGGVLELTPEGRGTVLYAFKGENDGAIPRGGLVTDSAGNLYGITGSAGRHWAGTLFRLDRN